MSETVRTSVRHIRDVVHHGRRLRILVLGDPRGSTFQLLELDGHDVWWCPDRQGSGRALSHRRAAETLEDLAGDVAQWDLVVAVEGFRRIQQVHSSNNLLQVFSTVADNSHALLVEAPRGALTPDLHDLSPYLTSDYLVTFLAVSEMQFESAPRRSATPLLLASNHGFFASGEWFSIDTLRVHSRNSLQSPGIVRTFETSDRVLKIELASEGFFDQCDVVAEADFLLRAREDWRARLGLPRVVHLNRGRAVNVLVRERIEGEPLTPGSCTGEEIPLDSVIDVASQLSFCRLFHNDFRPWNLLWTGSGMRVIDFANMSEADLDVQGLPQILALAGTIVALASPALPWGQGFVPAVLDLAAESGIWTKWSEGDLFGEGRSPWLAVTEARDGLVRLTTNFEQQSDATILSTVIEEIMTAHLLV